MSRKQRKLAGRRAWLALGTVTAYAAVSATGKAQATYPGVGTQKSDANASAQLPVQHFDIPAGPLDSALARFAKVSGISVQYTIPAETVPGFHTAGVSGMYSPPQALQLLLANTGLTFSLNDQNFVSVGLQHAESVN